MNLQSVWGAEEAGVSGRRLQADAWGFQDGPLSPKGAKGRCAFDTEGFWKKPALFSSLNMTCLVGPRTEDNKGCRTSRMVQLTNLPSEGVDWVFKALGRRQGIKRVKDRVI